ncbi:MAG: 2-amino-4-hydroxy-6-hydroxymethyldihydropteridine diphosphokinase [Ignavibacteriaceae bacterium]|nr:2-amino-4-hydroxy-6-hydroxymethyldihydropteridine diphosphokinase [Ignavibacteriaceae bacterium]
MGSNVGVQINNIDYAIELIDSNPSCEVEAVSSIYESSPYGDIIQSEFFNAVFKIKTYFELKELFMFLKSVEMQVGRKVTTKWGPREIDLDILFYNDMVFSDDEITIPHKDLLNRDFVLVPLCEIAPDLIHPLMNKKISEIIIFQSVDNESSAQASKKYILRKIPHRVLI